MVLSGKPLRSFLAAIATTLAPGASAMSAFSADVSDLWWNPAESGWGVNLIQQGSKLFATFFVYGADGRPRWYVASDLHGTSAPANQPIVFRGELYETTGPVVRDTFDPNLVTRRLAGSVTFEYHPPGDGVLTYTVDGLTVSKVVTRQTWATNEVAGDYWMKRLTRSTCAAGFSMEALGRVAVRRSGNSVTLTSELGACQYSGTYTQQGRMGRVEGTYSCGDGRSGAFTLSEIEVSGLGLVARLQASERGCGVDGNFGGSRATVQVPPS